MRWWWLLACGGSPAAGDRELYLAAAGQAPLEAAETCQRIDESALRADCLLQSAQVAAASGEATAWRAQCAAMPPGVLQEECWFLVADVTEAIGEQARALCNQSGRFRQRCLGHASSRAAHAAVTGIDAVGAEVAMHQRLVEVYADEFPGQRLEEHRRRAWSWMAGHLQNRWLGGDFDVALCGSAPEQTCQTAYIRTLQNYQREHQLDGLTLPRQLCSEPVTEARVRAAGVPAWTASSAERALAAWAEYCARPGPR